MPLYCYLTFPTTYFAIRAEEMLKKTSYPFKMVPVPRSISSSCGTSLRCSCTDLEGIINILQDHQVTVEGTYEVEEKEIKLPGLFAARGRQGNKQ